MNKQYLSLITGALLILFSTLSTADQYYGERCWQVFNESGEPYWKYKLGIYEKEGGHFTLFGSVDYGNTLSASHGNAILAGGSVKLTLNSGDYEEGNEVWAETFAAKLDPSSLNGTWDALTLEKRDNENDVFGVHQRGTINLIACQ